MNSTIRYSIRPYDTIWMLAQVFNTTVDSIMDLNPGIEPRNLQIGQVITIRPGHRYYPTIPDMPNGNVISRSYADLINQFRMLWERHVAWMDMAAMGVVHNLPEADLLRQRLLTNPMQFGDVFRFFYGDEIGDRLAQLMTTHSELALESLQAGLDRDDALYSQVQERLYQNADEIAAFLADINPEWEMADWSAMLYEHLNLAGRNINNMITGNHQESIDGYIDMELQALEMADMMADGIHLQFNI